MVNVKPFQAVRPSEEKVEQIASLPYDVMSRNEAKTAIKEDPDSFLTVERAEATMEDSVKPYDQQVYQHAKENYESYFESGDMKKDQTSSFYLYELTKNEKSQTGLVSCVSIDEYMNNTIKTHEQTREEKEQDRIRHVGTVDANTSPVFLTYRYQDKIDDFIDQIKENNEPEYDFATNDGVTHRVWVVDQEENINQLNNYFDDVQNLYIADGHHRAAAAVKVGQKNREDHPNYSGEESFNYFLAVLFPDNQLTILDYNRVVTDLNGLSEKEFLSKLEANFVVTYQSDKGDPVEPHTDGEFGLYLNNKWYQLIARENTYDKRDPIESLDVSILQNNLLDPILGIENPRTDDRIEFVGGIRGLGELEKRVDEDMTVAFSLFPTMIEDLIGASDAGRLMPPKSTWFEPKLRSGLFVHELHEENRK